MKHAYESKTIISGLYMLAVIVLPVIKDVITEEEAVSVATVVMGLIGFAGIVYGRIKATDKIKL